MKTLIAALFLALPVQAEIQSLHPNAPDGDAASNEANVALMAESVVEGVIIAADDKQLGLLQIGEELTTAAITIYQCCAATEVPATPVTAGDRVVLWYLLLPGNERLTTRVQRLPMTEPMPTVASVPDSVAAVASEAAVQPTPSLTPGGNHASTTATELLEEPAPALQEEAGSEAAPSDTMSSGPVEDEDRFSFGNVVGLTDQIITVREYDFARAADVETTYQVMQETEFGNIDQEHPLKIGDDVVLDYREVEGQRCITTLVVELGPEDPSSLGTFLSITDSTLTVLEFDRFTEAEREVTYQRVPETVYAGLSEDRPLRVGDSLILSYREDDGQRYLERLIRDDSPVVEYGCGFGEVVRQTEEGVLTIREVDITAGTEVDVEYQLTAETEFGSAEDIRQSPGNHVRVGYRIMDNQRHVTTLVRQGGEDPTAMADLPSPPAPE